MAQNKLKGFAMKKLFIAALAVGAFTTAGCATSGNKVLKDETRESVAEKLQPGMSQAQVTEVFGEPLDVTYTDSGNEIWKYSFTKGQVKATNFIPVVSLFNSGTKGKAKNLAIFFDTEGKVVRHSMSSSDVDTNTSIIG